MNINSASHLINPVEPRGRTHSVVKEKSNYYPRDKIVTRKSMGCVSLCVLFLVNLVVCGVGIAVVALSSYVIHTTEVYNGLITEMILMLPMWTLIGGLALTILGFLGFCGVLMKNSCMLRLYGALVLVFFLVELVCAILLFVMRKEAPEYLQDRMERTFKMYEEDPMLADSIDVAQHSLHCCGVKSYNDWYYILGQPNVTKGCCRDDDGVDADTCYINIVKLNPTQINEQIYTKGCYDSMIEDLADETLALAILSLILVMVQLTCITFAFTLANKIAKKKRGHHISRTLSD